MDGVFGDGRAPEAEQAGRTAPGDGLKGGVDRSRPSHQEQLIDELIFKQDLNEVHMLIDFVSGRADRSLRDLTIPHPDDPTKTMGSGDIMKSIAEMRYPPTGTRTANARNAFILLLAREQLTALAAPATPRTIAYTRLFIDAESFSWFGGSRKSGHDNENRINESRIDLAQETYPGLGPHAHKFRQWRDWLALFSLIWLLLTGLAYWDAGLGRTALERLDQDWKTIVGKLKDNPALISCHDGTSVNAGATLSENNEAIQQRFACREYNYLRVVATTAGEHVNDVFRCAEMGVFTYAHVWCWHWLLSGSAVEPNGHAKPDATPWAATNMAATEDRQAAQTPLDNTQVPPYARANVAYWQTATAILSVFTAYILPMMFSLLGTLIGAFRAILNRIGANELAPRDLVRMQMGIPTGLVAGVAVGLFLSPSAVPMQGAGAISGQLTLTASGLGFLAGYASHSFFGFLDNLIRTTFPSVSTPNTVVSSRPGLRTELRAS
jgi:hypothetical protein